MSIFFDLVNLSYQSMGLDYVFPLIYQFKV